MQIRKRSQKEGSTRGPDQCSAVILIEHAATRGDGGRG